MFSNPRSILLWGTSERSDEVAPALLAYIRLGWRDLAVTNTNLLCSLVTDSAVKCATAGCVEFLVSIEQTLASLTKMGSITPKVAVPIRVISCCVLFTFVVFVEKNKIH